MNSLTEIFKIQRIQKEVKSGNGFLKKKINGEQTESLVYKHRNTKLYLT